MAGLYIHIPYCHSKCWYCDFYSRPDDNRKDDVVDAIISEFHNRRNEIQEPFHTLYIGGGTPSCLPAQVISRLVNAIMPDNKLHEFTLEVNPEDVNDLSVRLWRSLGVDRISMGIQSLNDKELRSIGRRHTASEALQAIECISRGGISKVSCDLIYGLPCQTEASWYNSLKVLLDTGISHLSAYSLSYEPGTRLYAGLTAGKVQPVDEDTVVEMYNCLTNTTREYGMTHYEISNFAYHGFEAIHNSAYWNGTPYLGLGPSAHSFDGHIRRINPSSISQYLDHIPSFIIDKETPVDRVNDTIITRLRTASGLDLENDIPFEYKHTIIKSSTNWLAGGQMQMRGNKLVINEDSWIIADSILRDLIIE